jgi:2-polyprenyl-3-methyl-5-hydroxy-6-metoxy-1,4-benzoquinol methylase
VSAPAPNPGSDAGASAAPEDIATEYDLLYALTHASINPNPNPNPSPFLVSTVSGAGKPAAGATALDIGCGAGRNALYLARQGYQVIGVDLSRIGLDLTKQAAARAHLPVTTVAEDINRFPIGHQRWDLITLIDFPFAYRALLPRIAAGLKPGGLVVIQEISTRQPGVESPDHTLTYTFMDHRDLAAPFAGFTVLHDQEAEEATMWGVRAVMIRYAARKP